MPLVLAMFSLSLLIAAVLALAVTGSRFRPSGKGPEDPSDDGSSVL
jgi:hypothetical protein